jgi:prepilin-type processing-associated H-X9-DG protein
MIRKYPSHSSRGFTRTDLLVLLIAIGIIILLIAILLPGGPVSREIPDRTLCSMNLRSIIQSMTIYAQNNNRAFPYVSGPVTPDGRYGNSATDLPTNISGTPGASQNVTYIVSQWYTNANSAATGAGSPLGSLWLLVMQGQDTPKTFICPSDPIANNTSLEYGTADGSYVGNFGFMFGSDNSPNAIGQGESYSICFPYAYKSNASAAKPEVAGDWWVNDSRADQPIVSDMAPLSGAPVYSAGTGALVTDAPVSNIGLATLYRNTTVLPDNNTYGPYIFNSGNHNGDGQNIGYADGHVEWDTNPYIGQQGDNIFTINNSKPFNPIVGGTPLTGTGTSNAGITSKSQPQSPPYDTVMVPVRNVQTGDW